MITIDRDRLSLFKKVFKAHGLNQPYPRKFTGVKLFYNTPQYNCARSHKAVIEHAKNLNLPYVCIFEDDAYPINGVKEKLRICLSQIPDDCAVLMLGSIQTIGGKPKPEGNFIRGIESYGGHSYMVFKDYYDQYLTLLNKFPEGDGPLYNTDNQIIPRSKFFMPVENLFIQHNYDITHNCNTGYVWYYDICNLMKFPKEYIFYKGFPKIEDLLKKTK